MRRGTSPSDLIHVTRPKASNVRYVPSRIDVANHAQPDGDTKHWLLTRCSVLKVRAGALLPRRGGLTSRGASRRPIMLAVLPESSNDATAGGSARSAGDPPVTPCQKEPPPPARHPGPSTVLRRA